jgi:hypothetical protein
MKVDELREQYVEILLDRTTQVRYPSKEMLDRLEAVAYTREQAETLVRYLMSLVESARYPSHEMLDRIERIIFGVASR